MQNNFEYITTAAAQKIKDLMPDLTKSEARVAQFILLNLDQISYETGASIADKAAVSQITVSRFLKKAGYRGISALKEELKEINLDSNTQEKKKNKKKTIYNNSLNIELNSMMRLYEQFETDDWSSLVNCVATAKRVYISGFQSIRGISEDFARRLLLARDNVQYISMHDGMLAEWLEYKPKVGMGYDALVIFDVVPYASEGRKLCEIAMEKGIQIVIISDEFCYWASEYNAHTVHPKSKSGLFLESTWGLVLASNVLVDAVSRKNLRSGTRIKQWQEWAKRADIF
ncbi:MAG: MurR/RpiR family transcriptional regulator [Reichenbachiella sp.]|uniref:MurR/RpiR family transcriptional regulator n=1 Tax=Reichenbachiella sp. TaxID=2184521 RepID=UPI0032660721